MHACGHDGHTAIGLGVARLLSQQRDRLAGRVKFVFQPAEEIVEGARAMVADGVLDDPRPDVSLGLHVWNTMPVGVVGITEGPVMAGSSRFEMFITGRGGHAAMPQMTIDPVVCAAQIILALQTIVSRNVNPLESAVMSVTMMKGSDADNIIPERAMLGGTFRTFNLEMRDLVESRLRHVTEAVAAAMGCSVEIKVTHGTIPTINDATVTARIQDLFVPIVGEENLVTEARTMGSEDMAYFMDDIPGLFCFVGSANSARGLDYAHHHPRFDFDEDVLPLGVGLMTTAIAEYLLPK
jgi:amidohydrolase